MWLACTVQTSPAAEPSRIYPVVFGLLAATGMRVGELLALDYDEADLDAGVITVSRGKSRDPRLIPLHATTRQALSDYAAWRDQRDVAITDGRRHSSPSTSAGA